MKVSRITNTAALALLAGLGTMTADAVAQVSFPDAEGKETVLFACSQCHSLNRITRARLTADGWELIVYDMIARGAPVHREEVAALLQYLQDSFAVESE